MRFAVSIPPFTDPPTVVELAVDAEQAGWDAVFLWDHLQWNTSLALDIHDPWTLLGAIACRTERILLGTAVTPLARRRPWVVAKHVLTLDHLSGGRAMLGVGLGEPPDADFGDFGDPSDPKLRAEILDDGLDVLAALLAGDSVAHEGPHFQVDARLRPGPVSEPRPPIFCGAVAPHRRPLARALRYEGVYAIGADGLLGPDDLAAHLDDIDRPDGWDVFVPLHPDHTVEQFADAGATWLVESRWPVGDWVDELGADIRRGPPS